MSAWLGPLIGAIAGLILAAATNRWPRLDPVVELLIVVLCTVTAVDMTLGHFTRWEALWPVLYAVKIGPGALKAVTRKKKSASAAAAKPAAG